jgi:hypothetical protein
MRLATLIFAATVALSAYASTKYNPDPANKMQAPGIMTLSVAWIKDKEKKYDLNVTIKNERDDTGIIVFLSDMGCDRGDFGGKLKYTFFNTGERTIDFRPHQQKSFNMVCDTNVKATGPFKLRVYKVYDNPSMDGKTVGKVLATDLRWSQDDRHE